MTTEVLSLPTANQYYLLAEAADDVYATNTTGSVLRLRTGSTRPENDQKGHIVDRDGIIERGDNFVGDIWISSSFNKVDVVLERP